MEIETAHCDLPPCCVWEYYVPHDMNETEQGWQDDICGSLTLLLLLITNQSPHMGVKA